MKLLKSGGQERMRAEEWLYKELKKLGCEKMIFKQIQKYNGNFEDARDLFHESFSIMIEKFVEGNHQKEFKARNYLMGISRNLWMNKQQKEGRVDYTDDWGEIEESYSNCSETAFMEKERKTVVKKILRKLNEECREILRLWMLSYSMKEIAQKLSLSSDRIARKYKYRCHKKLINYLSAQPHLVKELIN